MIASGYFYLVFERTLRRNLKFIRFCLQVLRLVLKCHVLTAGHWLLWSRYPAFCSRSYLAFVFTDLCILGNRSRRTAFTALYYLMVEIHPLSIACIFSNIYCLLRRSWEFKPWVLAFDLCSSYLRAAVIRCTSSCTWLCVVPWDPNWWRFLSDLGGQFGTVHFRPHQKWSLDHRYCFKQPTRTISTNVESPAHLEATIHGQISAHFSRTCIWPKSCIWKPAVL